MSFYAARPTFATVLRSFASADGLAFGLSSYAVLKLLSGRATLRDGMLFVLAGLFIFRFFVFGAH